MQLPTLCAALFILAAPAVAQNPAGKWNGRIQLSKKPTLPANATEQQKAMVDQAIKMLEGVRLTLTINANRTFSMVQSGVKMPDGKAVPSQTTTGTWTQSGATVTITAIRAGTTEIPKAQQRPMRMTLAGRNLSGTLSGGGGSGEVRVSFTRA